VTSRASSPSIFLQRLRSVSDPFSLPPLHRLRSIHELLPRRLSQELYARPVTSLSHLHMWGRVTQLHFNLMKQ